MMSKKIYEMYQKAESMKNEVQKLLDENKITEAKAKMQKLRAYKEALTKAEKADETEKAELLNKVKGVVGVGTQKDVFYNGLINNGESFGKYKTHGEDEKDINLGKYIKGALTADWKGAEREQNCFKNYLTTTGTVLIPGRIADDIVDLARNRMVLKDVPFINMDTNNLTLAKIVKDPEFAFKPEGDSIKGFGGIELGKVELKSKTAYGVFAMTEEALYSANAAEIIYKAASSALAVMLDKYALYGKGITKKTGVTEEASNIDKLFGTTSEYETYEPKGITTYEDINIIDEQEAIEISKYMPFIKAVGMINNANITPDTVAFNSGLNTGIELLTNSNGDPLTPPPIYTALNKIVSNTVQDKTALVFDKKSIIMGVQQNLLFDFKKVFTNGTYLIRLMAFIDYAVINPKGITLIKYK